MKLQLIDDDGKTVVAEFDLGTQEGAWNVHSPDEADELVATIAKQVPYEPKTADSQDD